MTVVTSLQSCPHSRGNCYALIGIAPDRILEVRRPTRFRTALFATPVSYRNVAEYPEVLLSLRERLLSADHEGKSELGPRLWLDRGQQTRLGRKLINEEEVYRLLDRYSFERVDMGSFPVVQPNRHLRGILESSADCTVLTSSIAS